MNVFNGYSPEEYQQMITKEMAKGADGIKEIIKKNCYVKAG